MYYCVCDTAGSIWNSLGISRCCAIFLIMVWSVLTICLGVDNPQNAGWSASCWVLISRCVPSTVLSWSIVIDPKRASFSSLSDALAVTINALKFLSLCSSCSDWSSQSMKCLVFGLYWFQFVPIINWSRQSAKALLLLLEDVCTIQYWLVFILLASLYAWFFFLATQRGSVWNSKISWVSNPWTPVQRSNGCLSLCCSIWWRSSGSVWNSKSIPLLPRQPERSSSLITGDTIKRF